MRDKRNKDAAPVQANDQEQQPVKHEAPPAETPQPMQAHGFEGPRLVVASKDRRVSTQADYQTEQFQKYVVGPSGRRRAVDGSK